MSALVGDLKPDKWPEPNYVDPETRVPLVLSLMIIGAALSVTFTCGRLYAKAKRSNKGTLGLDDGLMALSTIMMLGVNILGCVSSLYGSGYHTWDIPASWPSIWGKIDLGTYVLFIPSVSLTKISLCVSYLKIFPSRHNQWFCYITISFLSVWTVTFVFLMLFACRPIAGFWDPSLPGAVCLPIKALLMLTGILNSVTDFLVFLWPVNTLWKIHLPLLQRISLVVAFGIGCLVCIAGVLRAWYMEVYFASPDPYWKAATLWVIVSLEGNLGIVCGCLPTLKPLAKKAFPRVFGSRNDMFNNKWAGMELELEEGRGGKGKGKDVSGGGREEEREEKVPKEGGVAVKGFPFGNISNPGKGSDEDSGCGWIEQEKCLHSNVWAEVGTELPENRFMILRTVTLHQDSLVSDGETAHERRSVDNDKSSEEHILYPGIRWSEETR